MVERFHDEQGVKWALLIDKAPDDLRWIYFDVKIVTTSHIWHNKNIIRDLEQVYQTIEEIDVLEFQLVEADK